MGKTFCVAAAALLLLTMRLPAHHAFASEYDEKKLVTVSGTVTNFKWTNPHAWLYVEGKDEAGTVGSWSFEMGSPNGLLHRGWKTLELKQGDQVTVTGISRRTAAIWQTPEPSLCRTAANFSEASRPPPARPASRPATNNAAYISSLPVRAMSLRKTIDRVLIKWYKSYHDTT